MNFTYDTVSKTAHLKLKCRIESDEEFKVQEEERRRAETERFNSLSLEEQLAE